MSGQGDKHILLALLLVCLVASISLSQSIASALLCQLNSQLGQGQLCQSVLLTTASIAIGTVAGIVLQLVTASSIRRRNRHHQRTVSMRWRISAVCLCFLVVASAIVSLVAMLLLGQYYTSMEIHRQLLANNVTRLSLVAGDTMKLRRSDCPDPLTIAKESAEAGNILFVGIDTIVQDKHKDACPGESAAFMRLQLNVITFNAALVAILLLVGVRQAAVAWIRMPMPWRLQQYHQQQMEEINLQEMAPMVAGHTNTNAAATPPPMAVNLV